MVRNGVADTTPAAEQLARLIDGYLVTQLLYVAAVLGIPEALADGPRDADELAAAVGAEGEPLRRVLRGLASEEILAEDDTGRFSLTALGAGLRRDDPRSLRGAAIARGSLYFGAAAELLATVRDGGVAFERAHGHDLFTHLAENPGHGAAFRSSMADRSRREAAAVVASYDFGRFRRVVDVGGGTGHLLATILAASPGLVGVLFDRPDVVAEAASLGSGRLDGRATVVGGDFFAAVPTGGDLYLLSRVIHDWDDEAATAILTNCRRAAGERGTVLLVEAVLPTRAREQPDAIRMDLHMLLLLRGRERTRPEFERVLDRAGLRLTRVLPTSPPAGVSLIEAVVA